MKDISIIIVNWNTCDYLRDCLQSVYEQTKDICFEVIVIDNASTDGSATMVKEKFPQTILLENSENRGFAAANNQGMVIADGRYVLLLNPDTIVVDRAIKKTMDFADLHPDVGMVGCQVLENETKIQRTCFAFPSLCNLILQKAGLRRLFPRSCFFGRVNMGWWDRKTERDVDVVSGMFMLVRHEAIEQVGLMDEDYFVYAEETDWCFRFWQAGWRRVFTPAGRIIHRDGGNKSTDNARVKMYVQLQKSMMIFYRKNRGLFTWMIAKIIYSVEMLARTVFWKMVSLIQNKDRARLETQQSLAALKFHLFGIESGE
ncbi:MAG: glycosyltransferase family 2 protein [Sedimentisphaerales bacterium]|nr:glycosyltransferase family 2 protein [Sedimentisphaerales bacterium]